MQRTTRLTLTQMPARQTLARTLPFLLLGLVCTPLWAEGSTKPALSVSDERMLDTLATRLGAIRTVDGVAIAKSPADADLAHFTGALLTLQQSVVRQGRRYVLLGGQNLSQGYPQDCHACSGVLLAAVFDGSGEQLVAASDTLPAAPFGALPEHITLVQLGSQRYGWRTQFNDVHQGYANDTTSLLDPETNTKDYVLSFPNTSSNIDALGTSKDRRFVEVTCTLRITPSADAVRYPLAVNCDGVYEHKHIHQRHDLPFDVVKQQYTVPNVTYLQWF